MGKTYGNSLYRNNEVYRVLQFKNREDWLNGRKTGIGGSDASVAIGTNPYKSNLDLWKEKTGRTDPKDISNNPAVVYGRGAEEPLRLLYQLKNPLTKVQYLEDVTLQSVSDPHMLYSPDGLLIDPEGRFGILEIKTASIHGSEAAEKWAGRIPDNYYAQVLHGLNVTGFEFVDLFAELSWRDSSSIRTYHIERSEVEEDLEFERSVVSKFWESVETEEEPDEVIPINF